MIGSFQEYSSNSAKYQITGYYRIDACRNTKQHLFLLYVCMLLTLPSILLYEAATIIAWLFRKYFYSKNQMVNCGRVKYLEEAWYAG